MSRVATVAVVGIIIGCRGGSSASRSQVDPRPAPDATLAPVDDPIAAVCDRVIALADGGCEGVAAPGGGRDACMAQLAKAGDDPMVAAASRCALTWTDCEKYRRCFFHAFATVDTGEPRRLRECADEDPAAAVGLTAEEWKHRRGATSTRFGDVSTTREQPIEVCDFEGTVEWLMAMTCADGSRPFTIVEDIDPFALAPVGIGGRCRAPIDRYEVPCPEGPYVIYFDSSMCPRP